MEVLVVIDLEKGLLNVVVRCLYLSQAGSNAGAYGASLQYSLLVSGDARLHWKNASGLAGRNQLK